MFWWFIPPTYGKFGDGLLLFYEHYIIIYIYIYIHIHVYDDKQLPTLVFNHGYQPMWQTLCHKPAMNGDGLYNP